MGYAPGDVVHLAGLGTGTVREPRGRGRYAVEIKGRLVVVAASNLAIVDSPGKSQRRRAPSAPSAPSALGAPGPSIDLHGKTVEEAVSAVELFVNDALLAGHGEVRIIHGRGGGRVKNAVHQFLRALPNVAAFRVDPRNPGVTIVSFT